MKVAITDACIFIDLYDLVLTLPFFGLELEIHTSLDVVNELYVAQQEVLKAFQAIGKLVVHNISEEDRISISQQAYPNSLSTNDKTVLYLAARLNAIVLSSDKVVRHNAKVRSIEYHGMLWIFDRLVEAFLITHKEAVEKLTILVNTNIVYRNNPELVSESDKRIKKWQKHQSG